MTSCDEPREQRRWIPLAEGFTPATVIGEDTVWEVPFQGGEALRLRPEASGSKAGARCVYLLQATGFIEDSWSAP